MLLYELHVDRAFDNIASMASVLAAAPTFSCGTATFDPYMQAPGSQGEMQIKDK